MVADGSTPGIALCISYCWRCLLHLYMDLCRSGWQASVFALNTISAASYTTSLRNYRGKGFNIDLKTNRRLLHTICKAIERLASRWYMKLICRYDEHNLCLMWFQQITRATKLGTVGLHRHLTTVDLSGCSNKRSFNDSPTPSSV